MLEPWARAMKSGLPPTARNARTGLLTPPGMAFCARAKSSLERSCFIEGRTRLRRLGSAVQQVESLLTLALLDLHLALDGARSLVDELDLMERIRRDSEGGSVRTAAGVAAVEHDLERRMGHDRGGGRPAAPRDRLVDLRLRARRDFDGLLPGLEVRADDLDDALAGLDVDAERGVAELLSVDAHLEVGRAGANDELALLAGERLAHHGDRSRVELEAGRDVLVALQRELEIV